MSKRYIGSRRFFVCGKFSGALKPGDLAEDRGAEAVADEYPELFEVLRASKQKAPSKPPRDKAVKKAPVKKSAAKKSSAK